MLLYIIHVLNSFTLTKRLCGDSLGPCSRFLQSSSHCRCRHSNHQIYTLHRSKPNRLWPFTHIWSYCRIISWNWFNGTCFLPHTWYWTFNTVFRALSGFLMFFHDFWWFSFHGRSRLEMVVHAAFTVFHASFTVGMDFWCSQKCLEFTMILENILNASWKCTITPSKIHHGIRVWKAN